MTEDIKARILCVEDEADIRENIAEILRSEGFEVFEAENGKRGYEVFLEAKPDLIISDIMMPVVDGYGLLSSVRKDPTSRNHTIPFIFLSALGQKEDVIKGVDMSANDYLVKPIDFDLMVAKVKEKTSNVLKQRQLHESDIKNIKDQVAVALPPEVNNHLDSVVKLVAVLKEQPYGPLPHRRYLEDLNEVYNQLNKLRAVLAIALDHDSIEGRIKANEEVIAIHSFLENFVSTMNEKVRGNISFDHIFDAESMPRVKIDCGILLESLKKIFLLIFKINPAMSVRISIIIDHFNQLVVVFYASFEGKSVNIADPVSEAEISKMLDQQNCRFDIAAAKDSSKDNAALLVIPSYRLIRKS